MRNLSPLEYRRFIVWTFPTVIDMLSVLDNRWVSIEHDTYSERITTRVEKRKGKDVTCYGVKPLDKRVFLKAIDKDGFVPFIGHIIQTLSELTPEGISSTELYGDAHEAISRLPDAPDLPESSDPEEISRCISAMRYVIGMGLGNLEKFNKICVYLAKVSLEMLSWYLYPAQTLSYGKVVDNESNKSDEASEENEENETHDTAK